MVKVEKQKATPKKATHKKIVIKLCAYDRFVLDRSVEDILETSKRTGATVVGPIPLPTRIEKFTVLRSPHVDRKSREQFEMRTHKRLIEIRDPSSSTIDALKGLNLPAGVDIKIRAA